MPIQKNVYVTTGLVVHFHSTSSSVPFGCAEMNAKLYSAELNIALRLQRQALRFHQREESRVFKVFRWAQSWFSVVAEERYFAVVVVGMRLNKIVNIHSAEKDKLCTSSSGVGGSTKTKKLELIESFRNWSHV